LLESPGRCILIKNKGVEIGQWLKVKKAREEHHADVGNSSGSLGSRGTVTPGNVKLYKKGA